MNVNSSQNDPWACWSQRAGPTVYVTQGANTWAPSEYTDVLPEHPEARSPFWACVRGCVWWWEGAAVIAPHPTLFIQAHSVRAVMKINALGAGC